MFGRGQNPGHLAVGVVTNLEEVSVTSQRADFQKSVFQHKLLQRVRRQRNKGQSISVLGCYISVTGKNKDISVKFSLQFFFCLFFS